MSLKSEGVAFTPVSMASTQAAAAPMKARVSREAAEPVCELCGHAVIASHCKRICLHCGFMTGCSEGV
jgi:hypothetical protein